MKTFETEKHNTPEGATHYFDETSDEHFAWWNDDKQMLLDPENANEWVVPNAYDDVSSPIPIPQTNIETPEEKEALDLIDTTPHQYERVANKDVGWNGEGLPPVGALCKVNRDSFTYRVMYSSEYVVIVQNLDNDNTTAHGMDIILDLHKGNYTFSKPESPQQREERECLEAAYDLYCHAIDLDTPFDKFCNFGPLKDIYIKIVDKTNYRKESN